MPADTLCHHGQGACESPTGGDHSDAYNHSPPYRRRCTRHAASKEPRGRKSSGQATGEPACPRLMRIGRTRPTGRGKLVKTMALVAMLILCSLLVPLAAASQQPTKVYRIGRLASGNPPTEGSSGRQGVRRQPGPPRWQHHSPEHLFHRADWQTVGTPQSRCDDPPSDRNDA
jgi:hypothetical protein